MRIGGYLQLFEVWYAVLQYQMSEPAQGDEMSKVQFVQVINSSTAAAAVWDTEGRGQESIEIWDFVEQ